VVELGVQSLVAPAGPDPGLGGCLELCTPEVLLTLRVWQANSVPIAGCLLGGQLAEQQCLRNFHEFHVSRLCWWIGSGGRVQSSAACCWQLRLLGLASL
jgi:hypothetical protein